MSKSKRLKKDKILIGLAVFAFLIALCIALMRNFNLIDTAQTVEAGTTAALVVVTMYYAAQTGITVKEMKKQRYATALPVIDILGIDEIGRTNSVRLAEAKAKSKETRIIDEIASLTHLACLLRNIGVGPATDVFSFITVNKRNEVGTTEHYEFQRLGPLERGVNLTNVASENWPLFLMQRNGCKFLVAYYFDVYGRCFESIREVTRDETTGELKINPLKVKKVKDEESELLSKGNYTDFVDKLWPASKQEVSR